MSKMEACRYNEGVDCNGGECAICGWNPNKEHKETPAQDNPYWERICKLSNKQRAKGMETYGQGLESNPCGIIERIEHLQEELIDGLMYCEWIKDRLFELESKK